MRYDNERPLYGSMFEDELESFNLIKVPNIEVLLIKHNKWDSTDNESIFNTYNYSYAYCSETDEFVNIIIKINYYYNGYYDLMSVYKSILTSQITAITVTYNGVDEVE